LHQPPWNFGFDSQTRGTRENRSQPCVKVPGSSRVPVFTSGQPSSHRPWLVVSRSTCPPLSPSPHANSLIKGNAVINTHIPCWGWVLSSRWTYYLTQLVKLSPSTSKRSRYKHRKCKFTSVYYITWLTEKRFGSRNSELDLENSSLMSAETSCSLFAMYKRIKLCIEKKNMSVQDRSPENCFIFCFIFYLCKFTREFFDKQPNIHYCQWCKIEPPAHRTPLWTGILTGSQLTLSRHYWVGI